MHSAGSTYASDSIRSPPAALSGYPVKSFRPLALAAAAAVLVEIVGRALRIPIAAATGLAATAAAVVYLATTTRESK